MARPRSRIPSYRLHKASGQAIVTLSGREHYLGPFDSKASRDAYERLVTGWQAHGCAPERKPLPLTIAAMVAQYWEHIERQGLYRKAGRRTSEQLCLRVALRPLVRLFGGREAAAFGPVDLVTVRAALCKPLPVREGEPARRRVHRGPIARSSVNKHVHRIRRVFRWAAAMQLVPAATWQALAAVDGLRRGQSAEVREPERVRPAPLRSVVAVLRSVGPMVAACIRLQWLTGMRPGEVVQLRTADVERRGGVWTYRPGRHKGQHRDLEREVPLGPRAQRILRPWLDEADPDAFVFRGRTDGAHVTEEAYAKAIARACRRKEVAHWTPHQLRHNAATRFRNAHGIEAARTVLGHTDAATTLIYAEADRGKARQVAEQLG